MQSCHSKIDFLFEDHLQRWRDFSEKASILAKYKYAGIFWRVQLSNSEVLPSKGSLNSERGLFGFFGSPIFLFQYFQIFSNQVLAKLIGFLLIVMGHMVYVISHRGCSWGCGHRCTRIGGHQFYTLNTVLPINHFPFLRPSMIILKMAEIRTLPELPKITTHTSVWSRPQLRLVEAAVQALEQLYSSLWAQNQKQWALQPRTQGAT